MLGNTYERAKKKNALCLSQSAFSNFFYVRKKETWKIREWIPVPPVCSAGALPLVIIPQSP